MITKIIKFLNRDLYFFYAMLLNLLAGSIMAGFRTGHFSPINLILGIGITFLALFLKAFLEYLTSNKINPFTKIRFSRQNDKALLLIITITSFMMFFLLLYLLLQRKILIGVNLFYICIIYTLLFLPTTIAGKVFSKKYDVVLEAFIVSPIYFIFGMGLQHKNPGSHDFLISVPLFFCYMATAIAHRMAELDRESTSIDIGMVAKLGWENAIKLHNLSILLTYLAFIFFLIFSKTFMVYWPILITSIIALFEIFLLYRISLGLKPNRNILKMTAILHYSTVIYLLIYPIV